MSVTKQFDNRLGVRGWLGGGHWGIERYAYTLHRLTGLGVLFYFFLHIFVTSLRVKGIYLWVGNGIFHSPLAAFGEYLVFAAFAYHACNGIRLVLVELGIAVGRPMEPVYPYKTSLNVQRPLLVLMTAVTIALLVIGGYSALVK